MTTTDSAKSSRLKLRLGCFVALVVVIVFIMSFSMSPEKRKVTRSRLNMMQSGTSTPLFPVRVEGKKGFINKDGELVIAPRFDNAYRFSEGLAAAMINDQWGYIDENGEWVIQPKFAMAGLFHSERACVRLTLGGPVGYIDLNGRIAIDFKFDCANDFVDGIAKVGSETITSKLLGGFADVGIECSNYFIDTDGNYVPALIEDRTSGLKTCGCKIPADQNQGENGRFRSNWEDNCYPSI
ncbi:MAG: WG repeat-containing protein [Phycisphaerae bacterium]